MLLGWRMIFSFDIDRLMEKLENTVDISTREDIEQKIKEDTPFGVYN